MLCHTTCPLPPDTLQTTYHMLSFPHNTGFLPSWHKLKSVCSDRVHIILLHFTTTSISNCIYMQWFIYMNEHFLSFQYLKRKSWMLCLEIQNVSNQPAYMFYAILIMCYTKYECQILPCMILSMLALKYVLFEQIILAWVSLLSKLIPCNILLFVGDLWNNESRINIITVKCIVQAIHYCWQVVSVMIHRLDVWWWIWLIHIIWYQTSTESLDYKTLGTIKWYQFTWHLAML